MSGQLADLLSGDVVFAQINSDNIVVQVAVVPHTVAHRGEEYLASDLNLGGRWILASDAAQPTLRTASVGDYWDSQLNQFVPPDHGISDHLLSWNGVTSPTGPSIMLESIPRSGNIFTATILKHGIPGVFQRWGYLAPHNPMTFEKAIGKFDLILVVLRDPLESSASWISMKGHLESPKAIAKWFNDIEDLFNAMILHKENLTFLNFNEVITSPQYVVDSLARSLQTSSGPLDLERIRQEIKDTIPSSESFYSLPTSNRDRLNYTKDLLRQKFPVEFDRLYRKYDVLVNL